MGPVEEMAVAVSQEVRISARGGALTVGELSATAVSRPKFACDGRPEHFAQLCRTPWTESGFKSRLSL
jgi:hypothetical protein